ncbi:DMT family transporter [Paroceanicella profunda]|uniref:DMT family transporter n=1 Tax=Paroceanicella profunda TaxID=2579971 RepID=A0A5B8FYI8_9RHOB|nr:DMT family transporter [Paroceanicella profunda]QDL92430.1 DMT family transporter [Paroceanicella profunda]
MNPIRGIVLKVMSVVIFMVMSAFIKATAAEVPPGEQVFFRSFFAIPPIVAWLWWRREFPAALRSNNPMGHFWRSLVGVSSMGCSFLALGLLPLPESVAIGYASPLLATIFAAMFLGENVRAYRIGAVALGLAGVVLVLSPRMTTVDPSLATRMETVGAFAALTGAVFGALAAIFVRKLVQKEPAAAIVFYFSVIASVLSLVTLPWGWVWPRWEMLAMLVAAGLFGGVGQILMTSSYRHAETSVIAPFEYTSMVFALGLGYFVFAEVPTWTMVGGAALVVTAGLLIIWREHALGIERKRARKAMTPQA